MVSGKRLNTSKMHMTVSRHEGMIPTNQQHLLRNPLYKAMRPIKVSQYYLLKYRCLTYRQVGQLLCVGLADI